MSNVRHGSTERRRHSHEAQNSEVKVRSGAMTKTSLKYFRNEACILKLKFLAEYLACKYMSTLYAGQVAA